MSKTFDSIYYSPFTSRIPENGRNNEYREYSLEFRKQFNENDNIACIVKSYTEHIPLVLKIHSKELELASVTEIMTRSTATTRPSINMKSVKGREILGLRFLLCHFLFI